MKPRTCQKCGSKQISNFDICFQCSERKFDTITERIGNVDQKKQKITVIERANKENLIDAHTNYLKTKKKELERRVGM